MVKFNFILLLYVGIIYVVEINSKEILSEDSVKNKGYAELKKMIDLILPDDALPLVLLKRDRQLRKPKILKSVTLHDGKMIHGTEFLQDNENFEQIFFCPKKWETCLVPKTFAQEDQLRCASQPTPKVESLHQQCGENKTGTYYAFNYEFCESNEYETTKMPFYTSCYDKKQQKTFFTVHTIDSPLLLKTKLLLREQEVNYPMMKKTEFPLLMRDPNDMEVEETPTLQYGTSIPNYKWRPLVPPEDMPLAVWRKTTFQETNTALQHEKLISLWDKISEHVRSKAIQMFEENNIWTSIHTGVFDVHSTSKNGNQLSNIWVKLIMTTYSFEDDTDPTQGVAILMDNFIDTETNQSTSSNTESKGIDGYCEQNRCIDALKDEFDKIKGRVCCCTLTKKILELFNENYVKLDELYIPHVNVTENQGNNL